MSSTLSDIDVGSTILGSPAAAKDLERSLSCHYTNQNDRGDDISKDLARKLSRYYNNQKGCDDDVDNGDTDDNSKDADDDADADADADDGDYDNSDNDKGKYAATAKHTAKYNDSIVSSTIHGVDVNLAALLKSTTTTRAPASTSAPASETTPAPLLLSRLTSVDAVSDSGSESSEVEEEDPTEKAARTGIREGFAFAFEEDVESKQEESQDVVTALGSINQRTNPLLQRTYGSMADKSTSLLKANMSAVPTIGTRQLGTKALRAEHGYMGKKESVIFLMTAIIGAGVLGIPYAFQCAGLAGGLVVLAFIAWINQYCLRILNEGGRYYQSSMKVNTYEELMRVSLGTPAYVMALIAILLGNLGTLTGFFRIIIDIGNPVFQDLIAADSHVAFMRTPEFLVAAFGLCVGLPLTFIPNLHDLIISNFIAVFSVVIVACAIVYRGMEAFVNNGFAFRAGFYPWLNTSDGGVNIIVAMPICLFSLGAHLQTIPVRAKQAPKVRPRYASLLTLATVACAAVDLVVGVSAYLQFGDGVDGDVLVNFPKSDPLIVVCKLLMLIHISMAIPIQFLPIRLAALRLVAILGWSGDKGNVTSPINAMAGPCADIAGADVGADTEAGDTAVDDVSSGDGPETHREHHDAPSFMEIFWTSIPSMLVAGTLACYCGGVQIVFTLVGGTTSAVINIVLPAFLQYKLTMNFYRTLEQISSDDMDLYFIQYLGIFDCLVDHCLCCCCSAPTAVDASARSLASYYDAVDEDAEGAPADDQAAADAGRISAARSGILEERAARLKRREMGSLVALSLSLDEKLNSLHSYQKTLIKNPYTSDIDYMTELEIEEAMVDTCLCIPKLRKKVVERTILEESSSNKEDDRSTLREISNDRDIQSRVPWIYTARLVSIVLFAVFIAVVSSVVTIQQNF